MSQKMNTVDFHITANCSQACPYCWGPRRFRKPVDTETAQRIIAQIKDLGVRRIVFTGGDPLQRSDALDLIRYAKLTGLETALSTTGDFLSHETLDKLYVMVFPNGSMTIPKGAEYLNFGPFLEVKDFEQVLNASQFDSAKHLRHSRGWGKESLPTRQVLNGI